LARRDGDALPGGRGNVVARTRPAFARLRFDNGSISAPAIVAILDALRENVREARGRKAETAALQLSDETEEGLWLWEVLHELETAERDHQQDAPGIKRSLKPAGGDGAEERHLKLGYEEFIAGRQLRSDHQGAARNSLEPSFRSFATSLTAFSRSATSR
jgi:hypothetical protein